MNCVIHGIAMEEKNGQYGIYYSHTIQGAGYCNGTKITPFKKPQASPLPGVGSIAPKPRDYEAEGRGKVRFGFAIEAYKFGRELNKETIKEINEWTEFVMTGNVIDPKQDEEPSYP